MNVYFVTGSSKGLGKALCELLLTNPENRVIGLARSSAIEHERYEHRKLDLTDLEAVAAFEFTALPECERMVLVNNAGSIGEIKPNGKLDAQAIALNYDLNISAPSILCNAFIRAFQQNSGQRIIINVSSGAAQNAIASWSGYCAAKAALEMYSRVIAEEQKSQPNPIRILSVAPGIVDTGMQVAIRSANPEEFSRHADFINYHESGQLASAQDVAEKYRYIIDHVDDFSETVTSVRNL